MSDDVPSTAELAQVAVFPLPNLVLFPGTRLSLHLFEPRYRQMMADCLREPQPLLAVAQLKPGWQADYYGRPALYEVAGVGRVVRHALRNDGTYDIELLGLGRVRLRELPAEQSYRRAAATLLEERSPEQGLPRSELAALLGQAAQVVQLAARANPGTKVELLASSRDAPERLLDKLADQFVSDPEQRQALLETLDTAERLDQLKQAISGLHVALLSADPGSGPRTLH
jgi:Lon protease-like protein